MLRWTVCLKEGPAEWSDAAVPVGPNIYYFGRYNVNESDQIEVHIFNIVSLRWRKLAPVTTGSGERPLEVPSRRWGHTAVLLQDIIYIWGGYSFSNSYCNILYAFDVDTHRWLKPKVSGTVPEGRRSHSACVFGKVIYIHGGYSFQMSGFYTNDIYKLDTTIMVWSLIKTRGTTPPVSSAHSATIIGTKMFVFGGCIHDEYSNSRVFDIETNCWLSTPSAQLLQERRSAHSAFTYNGELYIFGGINGNKYFNDLWKLNPVTFFWKKVKPKGKGPGGMYGMYCCMVGDRIILFGGYPTPHDLYILDLSPSLKSLCKLAVIQYGVKQSELPHNIRWELAAMNKKTVVDKLTSVYSFERAGD